MPLKSLTLHHGSLQFSAIEQGSGPIVLCLHGFPDNASSYRNQLPVLAEAGYRAISVTLRGYEPSSQAAKPDYSIIRMAEDVIAWIDELGEEKVHLVGHDWGAVIAYVAGAMAPERFNSLTTMAVPHLGRFAQEGFTKFPKQIRYSWYMFFFQLRFYADYKVEKDNFEFIRWLWKSWCPEWDIPQQVLDDVIGTFQQSGVKKAALGYYRAMFNPFSKGFKESTKLARGKINVPTLAITGNSDGCIHSDVFVALMKEEDFPSGLKVEQIQGAGHFLHQEKPEQVNALITDWIQQYS